MLMVVVVTEEAGWAWHSSLMDANPMFRRG